MLLIVLVSNTAAVSAADLAAVLLFPPSAALFTLDAGHKHVAHLQGIRWKGHSFTKCVIMTHPNLNLKHVAMTGQMLIPSPNSCLVSNSKQCLLSIKHCLKCFQKTVAMTHQSYTEETSSQLYVFLERGFVCIWSIDSETILHNNRYFAWALTYIA